MKPIVRPIESKPLLANLGCGDKRFEGWINVDKNYDADINSDLNNGWPFADTSVDYAKMIHVLEHLENPSFQFREAWRTLKPGGKFEICVPNAFWFPLRVILFFCDIGELWQHKFGVFRPHFMATLFGKYHGRDQGERTGHLTHWSKRQLEIYALLNGFGIEETKGHHLLSSEIKLICYKIDGKIEHKEARENGRL